MKKRMIVLCLSLALILILCSCGDNDGKMSVKESIIRMELDDRYTVKVANTEGHVEWTSANDTIAVVSADGTVSAVGNGITTVTARNKDQYVHIGVVVGGNNEYRDDKGNVVQVFDGVSDITEISVGVAGGGKGDITVKSGDKFQLRAYVVPSNSKDPIVWKTNDSSVARVNEKGMMEVVGRGTTKIIAYAPNGIHGTLTVRSN